MVVFIGFGFLFVYVVGGCGGWVGLCGLLLFFLCDDFGVLGFWASCVLNVVNLTRHYY